MTYTLIGSLTSPYVRKLRLVCHDRVPLDFKAINWLETHDADYLAHINPINKIPILVFGEQKIFDSRVIYNYLAKTHGWTALTLDEENLVSAFDGLNDTLSSLFLMAREGLDIHQPNLYLSRQKDRAPNILAFAQPFLATRDPKNAAHWTYPTIAAYSVLDWARVRKLLQIDNYPIVQKFLSGFAQHPGVQETVIP